MTHIPGHTEPITAEGQIGVVGAPRQGGTHGCGLARAPGPFGYSAL